ncbi:MAG TPA: hypothetical protein VGE72_17030 [Azospirillum sp.]
MPSLWHTLLWRWLEPRAAPDVSHLSDHLLRDLGLAEGADAPLAAEPIRDRNFSSPRTFCTLHP